MPDPTFRGDPYGVLGVAHEASDATIKRRWRELAREHHPDRATGIGEDPVRLTTRMARINAAYDLLRDPVRRARYDASPQARRSGGGAWNGSRKSWEARDVDAAGGYGPPPPRQTTPVTARYDTSAAFHGRNTTTSSGQTPLRGHPPASRRGRQVARVLRASTPTGPVRRRPGGPPPRAPSLEEARSTVLDFGRFHGQTLGDVADEEPTYIDWISQTITRDRDLVQSARVIQVELDDRGVERIPRTQRHGFGNAHSTVEDVEGVGASASR